MTATIRHSPDQGYLFSPSRHNAYFEIPVDPDYQKPDPTVDLSRPVVAETIGPVTNLIERAENLKVVTEKLAEINRTRGLHDVLETPKGRQVDARYHGDAKHILHKAEAISGRRMRQAKSAFARATGMYALIDFGLATTDEAKASTQEDWRTFLGMYADGNQANRKSLRRQQDKLVRTLSKKPKP